MLSRITGLGGATRWSAEESGPGRRHGSTLNVDHFAAARPAGGERDVPARHAQGLGHEPDDLVVGSPIDGRRGDPELYRVTVQALNLGRAGPGLHV